jgi:hypothetical protein
VKVARIIAFIDSRWFMVRGAAINAKFYKQERLYCMKCCVKKRILFLQYRKIG